jgi:hypothetical protein
MEDPVIIYSILGGFIAFTYALSLILIKAYLAKKKFQRELSASGRKDN